MIWNNCKNIQGSVWEDLASGEEFDTTFNWQSKGVYKIDSDNSYFISDKENFITGNKWDVEYIKKYYIPHWKDLMTGIAWNKEIMYTPLPELKKIAGSKVLIVGGGPSAAEKDWDPNDYDYVFSCNHFYLNEKLNNHDVFLAIMGQEVDFSFENNKLHEYMNRNNTIICFDDRTSEQDRKDFELVRQEYPSRRMYLHTRYRGKPGTALRLLCLAIFLEPKEIHFVGVDGMGPDTKKGDLHGHAFQKGKKYSHNCLNYDLYRRHYVAFWDYVINNLGAHEKIRFQNLGEGHPKNQTTDISRQIFPLEV